MYALFCILFSLFSGPLNAQSCDKNTEESVILRAMRVAAVADAPLEIPREDSFLLAADSYNTEREKLKKEADIYEMKDPQENVSGALFVTFEDDPKVVYLSFPGVRGISAEQGFGLSHDIKYVLSASSTSVDGNRNHRVQQGVDKWFDRLQKTLGEKILEKRNAGQRIVFSGHCLGAARAERALYTLGQEGNALLTFAPVIKPFDEKTQQDFTEQNPNVAMYNFTLEDDFWFGQPFKTLVKPLSYSMALGIPITLPAPSNDWWWNTHRAKRYISVVGQWLKTPEGQRFSQELKQHLTVSH
ncbi:MAG: hypothetical protein ACPGUZ_00670 [Holosporaceae bacterium]